MSRSHHHFLAILPLFAILSISPMEMDSHVASRTIASEIVSGLPKYEARAAKIDRTKIVIDKDLDLSCFSDRADALRTRLLQTRKDYKVDEVGKDEVAAQRVQVDSLVSGMVDLEEDMKVLKEKKAWDKDGEIIADKSVAELKITLEALLQDEVENEFAVLKDKVKKDEAAQVAAQKPEVKKEEPKPEVKPEAKDDKLCELEEKNKVLTKQVEDLLEQQKTIMQTLLGMSNMMVQMNQQQSQQSAIPQWLLSGSMMNQQLQYPFQPSTMGNGAWVYYPQSIMPQVQRDLSGQSDMSYGQQGQQQGQQQAQPQMGQQGYQQNLQSNQYQYQVPYSQYDQRYLMPQPMLPGNFGQSSPFSHYFGSGPSNVQPAAVNTLPIRSA